jgi:hypothetical protein
MVPKFSNEMGRTKNYNPIGDQFRALTNKANNQKKCKINLSSTCAPLSYSWHQE